jgi:hypothetical protein
MACFGGGGVSPMSPTGGGTGGLSNSPYGMGSAINSYNNTNDQSMGLDKLSSMYADTNAGNKSNDTDWKKTLSDGLMGAAKTQLQDLLPSSYNPFTPQGNTSWQNQPGVQYNPYNWYRPQQNNGVYNGR